MPYLELTVEERQAGRTVLSLLRGELGLSSTLVKRLKRTDRGLLLNGAPVHTDARPRPGDRLTADLSAAERPAGVEPVELALDILFEDEHLLLLNKSAPLAVIPSSLAPGEPTLAGGVVRYLGPGASFHPVNRLDRGTTGLMAVAKTGYMHDRLRRQLHGGGFQRTYLAVCVGRPDPPAGTVDLPIGRAPGSAVKRQVCPDGQAACTRYRTLCRNGDLTLVALWPQTGRTHQIRVHMAAMGCPLAGDWLYGTEDRALIPRPALHACRLTLRHPATGALLDFTAPLPADMKRLRPFRNCVSMVNELTNVHCKQQPYIL